MAKTNDTDDAWISDADVDVDALLRAAGPLPPPRRPYAVTIREVAYRAGVSMQTVSRVINRAPNVRPAMFERVTRVIDELGYVPSRAAQAMNGSRSYVILAVNDRDRTLAGWRSRTGNDWVDQMLLGGFDACQADGYRLLIELCAPDAATAVRELRQALAAVRPDGVILTPPHADMAEVAALLEARRIPYVRLGAGAPHARATPVDDGGPGYGMAVAMDEEGAAALATRHLIDAGHRAIGFIAGDPRYAISDHRAKGWLEALVAAGVSERDAAFLYQPGDFTRESGIAAARALLSSNAPPTAILASNDQMALGVLAVARDLELSVPRDLSILSFDDGPSVALASPPLSAIDQPIAELAAIAVRQIIAARRDDVWPDGPTIRPAALVARASVGPPGVTPEPPRRPGEPRIRVL